MRFLIFLAGVFLMSNAMAFTLTSSAFKNGESIPAKYTCKGENISPPLNWTGIPANTQSFALIIADPDAPVGTWYHWVLYNIPGTTDSLAENVQKLPSGTLSGKSSYNDTQYKGPCPPSGQHRYFFNLYALDAQLNLPYGATHEQVEAAMQGHIIKSTELMGLFRK